MKHFLFGYGSLISQHSRQVTGRTGVAIHGTVKGLRRAWNVFSPGMRITGVGVIPDDSSTCNGVFVEIDESEIPAFDKREMEGTNYSYERQEIKREQILELNGDIPIFSKIWVYVVKKPAKPTWDYPIAQSYLDVILTGCLDFGDGFAKQFLVLTQGWHAPWINDRKCPRYSRAINHAPTEKIDVLLKDCLGNLIEQRKDEC